MIYEENQGDAHTEGVIHEGSQNAVHTEGAIYEGCPGVVHKERDIHEGSQGTVHRPDRTNNENAVTTWEAQHRGAANSSVHDRGRVTDSSDTRKRKRRSRPTILQIKKSKTLQTLFIQEASVSYHAGAIWLKSNQRPPHQKTPSKPSLKSHRLPRKAHLPIAQPVLTHLTGVEHIDWYPGKRSDHEIGRGPSKHPGAGLGIIALSPLLHGVHGLSWHDNIFCQYVGRIIPMELAENPAYLSDYILGWPCEGEAIDGQLDNNGSVGHLINDDFSRDGGSLDAIRDPKTGNSYLYLTEDVQIGDEPCFAYGSDFWQPKLRLLPPTARKACIGKYNFSSTALLALGFNALGKDTTSPKPLGTQPPQERTDKSSDPPPASLSLTTPGYAHHETMPTNLVQTTLDQWYIQPFQLRTPPRQSTSLPICLLREASTGRWVSAEWKTRGPYIIGKKWILRRPYVVRTTPSALVQGEPTLY